jgi:hypothetical protein
MPVFNGSRKDRDPTLSKMERVGVLEYVFVYEAAIPFLDRLVFGF